MAESCSRMEGVPGWAAVGHRGLGPRAGEQVAPAWENGWCGEREALALLQKAVLCLVVMGARSLRGSRDKKAAGVQLSAGLGWAFFLFSYLCR